MEASGLLDQCDCCECDGDDDPMMEFDIEQMAESILKNMNQTGRKFSLNTIYAVLELEEDYLEQLEESLEEAEE